MKPQLPARSSKQRLRVLATTALATALFIFLSGLINLILWGITRQDSFLLNAGGLGASALLAGLTYFLIRAERLNWAVFLLTISWTGYFVLHGFFWAHLTLGLLIGLWVFPVLFLRLAQRYKLSVWPILGIALIASIALLWFNQNPLWPRFETTDLTILRFVVPAYIAVFGMFALILSLAGLPSRTLLWQILPALLVLVITPISILALNAHYNALISETDVTSRLLMQILRNKNNQIQAWLAQQADSLDTPLTEFQSRERIIRLLETSQERPNRTSPDFSSVILSLNQVLENSDFEEIYLFNKKGIVIASTNRNLIGQNFEYQEFFWRGKTLLSMIPPRYYAPANQVSLFFSMPIRNVRGELIGVLSGRASLGPLLNILQQPVPVDYRTLRFSWLGADGMLISSALGRPTQSLQTAAAETLLSNFREGNDIYKNTDGATVIGAYLWNDNLKAGLIAEVEQREIYQPILINLFINSGIAISAFVLAALASWLIARSIVQPINVLVESTQKVISGNLDIVIESEREDEIGILTQAFNDTTAQLKTLVTELEKRVEERTKDLEERSLQLQTAAEIARDTALANRLDDLLDKTVRLISERFGFYHVGIFLNDDKNEFAVLWSASSEAGKVMLANKHRLPLGTGLVGYVAKWGEARIALDVGEDAVHFRNPFLPYTRSEMALPIQTRGRILGVLDIQSEKANAFDQADIQIMQIITDQLAVAIEKIQLLEELQESSQSLERALRAQTARAWREFVEKSRHTRGYRYEGARIEPLEPELLEQLRQKVGDHSGAQIEKGEKNTAIVHVPLQLRGQVLGGLSVRFNTDQVPAETIALIEEAANRLALALENARLLQDAQRLANREQQINLIASQVQRATEIEALLQTAARELGKVLDVPRSFIQIGFVPLEAEKSDPTG